MGLRVKFWGARGSIPAPGPNTVRIGGNTTCVELSSDENGLIIIDAGTGIRSLGSHISKNSKPTPIYLLLTHSHWDHLSGFTFFGPAFNPNYSIQVFGNKMAQEVLQRDIMGRNDNRYSPVNNETLRANFVFHENLPKPLKILGITITTLTLNHPGNGYAYRFDYHDHSLAFITDNEIGMQYEGGHSEDEIIDFCRGVDVLIHDAQYLPSEIEFRRGWGHSTYEEALDIAHHADVPHVLFTHHDPERTDEQCTSLLEEARNYVSSKKYKIFCELAIEDDVFNLG